MSKSCRAGSSQQSQKARVGIVVYPGQRRNTVQPPGGQTELKTKVELLVRWALLKTTPVKKCKTKLGSIVRSVTYLAGLGKANRATSTQTGVVVRAGRHGSGRRHKAGG